MSKDISSLDQRLFTAEAWRPAAGGCLNAEFKGLTLKTKLGEFEAGTKFPFGMILGDASVLVLVDEANKEHGFSLSLSVGDTVDLEQLKADLFSGAEAEDEACDCGHEHTH